METSTFPPSDDDDVDAAAVAGLVAVFLLGDATLFSLVILAFVSTVFLATSFFAGASSAFFAKRLELRVVRPMVKERRILYE